MIACLVPCRAGRADCFVVCIAGLSMADLSCSVYSGLVARAGGLGRFQGRGADSFSGQSEAYTLRPCTSAEP